MSGCSLAKPLFTASTSAMTSRLRFDTSAFAAPLRRFDHFVGLRRPAHAAVEPATAARELVLIGVAGDERIFVEHEAQRAGRGLRIEVAQHRHRHAGFLREIADEELALVELRGGERLAGERVHRGDAAIDDHHVGAARVADLHRHHRVELAAEHGERVGGGGRGGELPLLSGHQVSLSLIESFTLKPYSFAKNESAFGSRPPLATMRPP